MDTKKQKKREERRRQREKEKLAQRTTSDLVPEKPDSRGKKRTKNVADKKASSKRFRFSFI